MRLRSSFTFSSEAAGGTLMERGAAARPKRGRRRYRDALATFLWTIVFLVIFDAAANRLFRYPADPQAANPSQMQMYFEYGRSIEGKLDRMIGPTDETTSPAALAGWLKARGEDAPMVHETAAGNRTRVTIYGMSFSNHVGEALGRMEPGMAVTLRAGPAAPPNHSFASYELERKDSRADVVVLGILASSVKGMGTLTSLTTSFEMPTVYTYPKYVVRDGKLEAIWPTLRTLEEFRAARREPAKWNEFLEQLRREDAFYDAYLMRENVTDGSAILRMVRRGWGQREMRNITATIHTEKGFVAGSPVVESLNAVVGEFAATAREDHRLPVVLLFNDQGYGDHLYRALAGTLEREEIAYVSTHTIAPATDPRNFVADGHFRPEVDEKIAEALRKVIVGKVPGRTQVTQNR